MEKIEKILLSVAAIVFSVSIIGLTLSDAKFIFGLARHGKETLATVIDTKSQDEGRGIVLHILTVEYTDNYNKTYIKNDIKTYKNLNPGDKITIIYNKFSPQVADIKGNHKRKNNFSAELFASFMIIIAAIYYYQEFKFNPNYWKFKKRY
ncbi:MAG: hypothetical protein M3Z52_07530 [Snodgrassella alvi]|nr:DUF3592 domain-containing protein [Snodgrassella alvi]MCT6883930.1 hypothetical protein [Snodgrassella alvi]